MTLSHLISDQRLAQVRASAFAWMGWLLQIALCIGVFSKSRRLRRLVQRAERWVACYCFLVAAQNAASPRRRFRHPRGAPIGFRHARGNIRLLLKSARIRAKSRNLAARIASVSIALADPEPYIAHFAKRITSGLVSRRLVAVAPANEIARVLSSTTPALADSS
ncbi:MAG: hypothetical protein ABL871_13460 [Terricaulis sp.]